MDLRRKPHRSLLRSKMQADFLACFLAGGPLQLASAERRSYLELLLASQDD